MPGTSGHGGAAAAGGAGGVIGAGGATGGSGGTVASGAPDAGMPGKPDASSADASDASAEPAAVVSNETLTNLLVMGYQGWFTAPTLPPAMTNWVHWSNGPTPGKGNVQVDGWPDLQEFTPAELIDTNFHFPDNSVAQLYSAYNEATVVRHMKWAKDYGIDGVFLQRFLVATQAYDPVFGEFVDKVAQNIVKGAEQHGRVFAIEYDLSGAHEPDFVVQVENDWKHLVDDLKVTASDRYLQHRGKPLLILWGLGFTDRPGTPAQANALIDWLTQTAPPQYRVTLAGGVPTHWRELNGDSKTDPAWGAVYRRFDVIHPWMVGRFKDDAGAANFRKTLIEPDLAEAKKVGADYLPVVFPGFSWANLMKDPTKFNQIPRRGGVFWWKQLYEYQSAGCNMIFGAMFDEVDEGTAMFKMAATAAQAPVEEKFLTLDTDGLSLPSDFYLQLAGAGTRMLHGEIPLSATIPADVK